MQDKGNNAKEWQDAQGCRLKICGYNAGYYGEAVPWVRLRSTEDKFDMLSLATLNEIRAHLDILAREVFGEKALTVADVLAKIETLSAASKKRWEEADDELEGARAHAIGCILLELRQFIQGGAK